MEIDFEKCGGLVPAIIQDAQTKNVLMMGYMNPEAYQKTLETGKVTFWSRSRQCLWTKGETSGNFLWLVNIKVDCDKDTLLVTALFLSELQDFIEKRHREMPEGSYTTSLFKKGVNRMAQKVGEEALETVIEATNGSDEKMVYEAADMLYHLVVLLTSKGLRIEDIARELATRHDPNWDKQRRLAKSKDTETDKNKK